MSSFSDYNLLPTFTTLPIDPDPFALRLTIPKSGDIPVDPSILTNPTSDVYVSDGTTTGNPNPAIEQNDLDKRVSTKFSLADPDPLVLVKSRGGSISLTDDSAELAALSRHDNRKALKKLLDQATTSPIAMLHLIKLAKDIPELAPLIRNYLSSKFLARHHSDLVSHYTAIKEDRYYDSLAYGMKHSGKYDSDGLEKRTATLRDELGLAEALEASFGGVTSHLSSRRDIEAKIAFRDYLFDFDPLENRSEDILRQIALLLAYKSEHPAVKALLAAPDDIHNRIKATQDLIQARVAEGIKVLDLGCGSRRGFGVLATRLGAQVHTISLEPFQPCTQPCFGNMDKYRESPGEIARARPRHLQLDLYRPDTVDITRFMFGKNFDMVTEVNLQNANGPKIDHIALPLLKRQGGIMYGGMFSKLRTTNPITIRV